MRKAFAILAALLTLVVVAQFFFAATGAFSTAPNEVAFEPHYALGYVIFSLPVIMMVVAALARMPGRLIGLAGLVAALASLQVLIAVLARAFGDRGDSTAIGPIVFGLHAVNGLVILAVSATISRQAGTLWRSSGPGPSGSMVEPAQPAPR